MIYTVYTEQSYQGRKIPLLAVFIIVKTNDKSIDESIQAEYHMEKYIISKCTSDK
jgi:hypothetical protein